MAANNDNNSSGRFDFVGKSKFCAILSGIAVLVSIFYLQVHGLNFGIDFAGGTEIQVLFSGEQLDANEVRSFTNGLDLQNVNVQQFGEANEFLIRFQGLEGKTDKETNQNLQEDISKVLSGFKSKFPNNEADIRRVDTVGPQVGDELKRNGFLAAFYSLMVILIYVGLRFDYVYAPGAVIALFHDVTVTLGIFVLLGKEVNIQILAALLTLIGYSLNDTIIIYDRVREDREVYRDKPMPWVVNHAINNTLSRTIITSGTTFMTVLALYLFAGGVIQDLAFTLGLGIVIGTYSTIYVASPTVILLDRLKQKKKA